MNIQGIELDPKKHGGKEVTYLPKHAKGNIKHPDTENGTIKRWSSKFVFVRFPQGVQAVNPEYLMWGKL